MRPLFKIYNHRAAHDDVDNNPYSTNRHMVENLHNTYKNKNMDNDIVDIPHSTNIPFVFLFAFLFLTKLLDQDIHLNKYLVCIKRPMGERGLHLNKPLE